MSVDIISDQINFKAISCTSRLCRSTSLPTCGKAALAREEDRRPFRLAFERAEIEPELRMTNGGHVWALWLQEFEPVLRFVNARFGVR